MQHRSVMDKLSQVADWKLPLLVFILSLPFWVQELGKPIHGSHYFRQAHVQANIDRFLDDGLLLLPRTYNFDTPGFMYDFPLYQWTVMGIVQTTGLPSLLASRLLSVLVLLASIYLAYYLLAELCVGRIGRLLATLFYAISPFMIFYGPAPMVDGLACACMLAAALCYLKLERIQGLRARSKYILAPALRKRAAVSLLLMVVTLIAAVIKITVLLPLCVAVGISTWQKHGFRFYRDTPAMLMGVVSLLGLVAHQITRKSVNGGQITPNDQASWVFGTLADRLAVGNWERIAARAGSEILPPVPLALAALGLCYLLWLAMRRGDSDSERRLQGSSRFILFWIIGCIIYFLLCFRLHLIHDYYQYPFLVPIAGVIAFSVDLLARRIRSVHARLRPMLLVLVGLGFVSAVYFHVKGTVETLEEMEDWGDGRVRREAKWIRSLTQKDDFVVYLTKDAYDWNPAFLYFAKRHGYNLGNERLNPKNLKKVVEASLTSASRRVQGYRGYAFFVREEYGAAARFLAQFGIFELHEDKEIGKLFYLRFPKQG